MKLFILKPKKNEYDENSPWNPWYDKRFGFVIQAENIHDARKIANENVWMSEEFSSCEELVVKENDGAVIIMSDVHSA